MEQAGTGGDRWQAHSGRLPSHLSDLLSKSLFFVCLSPTRRPVPPPDSTHAINSRKGLLGFFTAGTSDHVSDQGLAEVGGLGRGFASPSKASMSAPQKHRGVALLDTPDPPLATLQAARYHEAVRPLEGRMRIPQPSATAPRGAKFSA